MLLTISNVKSIQTDNEDYQKKKRKSTRIFCMYVHDQGKDRRMNEVASKRQVNDRKLSVGVICDFD